MKRPANTKYYEFDTTNPLTGIRGGDCVVRSISLAMELSWEEVFDELCKIGRKMHRMPSDDKVFQKYLTDQHWICQGQPRKADNSKYTGKDYISSYGLKSTSKPIILSIGSHHLSCIKEGKFHDIWDPSEYCVGKIWRKM